MCGGERREYLVKAPYAAHCLEGHGISHLGARENKIPPSFGFESNAENNAA